MTPTEVKQAADEMVEVFRPYAYAGIFQQDPFLLSRDQECNATRISIAHCKLVIEVLEKLRPTLAVISFSYIEQLNTHRLILSELEGRVK
jgi:hypothetical protein